MRLPKPATGMTAFVTFSLILYRVQARSYMPGFSLASFCYSSLITCNTHNWGSCPPFYERFSQGLASYSATGVYYSIPILVLLAALAIFCLFTQANHSILLLWCL
jgi:hypothetical protein